MDVNKALSEVHQKGRKLYADLVALNVAINDLEIKRELVYQAISRNRKLAKTLKTKEI